MHLVPQPPQLRPSATRPVDIVVQGAQAAAERGEVLDGLAPAAAAGRPHDQDAARVQQVAELGELCAGERGRAARQLHRDATAARQLGDAHKSHRRGRGVDVDGGSLRSMGGPCMRIT